MQFFLFFFIPPLGKTAEDFFFLFFQKKKKNQYSVLVLLHGERAAPVTDVCWRMVIPGGCSTTINAPNPSIKNFPEL